MENPSLVTCNKKTMTLDRKWEKFRGGPQAGPMAMRNQVRVTINQKGLIYMNTRMFTEMGRPKAVALYYSREDDAIAVQSAYERFDEHFLVVKRQTGWAIHASTFCRHYNIRVPNTERFLRPDLDSEGTLILTLRETVTVGGIEKGPRRTGRTGAVATSS